MKKKKYTDDELLGGIRQGTPAILQYIFDFIYPSR